MQREMVTPQILRPLALHFGVAICRGAGLPKFVDPRIQSGNVIPVGIGLCRRTRMVVNVPSDGTQRVPDDGINLVAHESSRAIASQTVNSSWVPAGERVAAARGRIRHPQAVGVGVPRRCLPVAMHRPNPLRLVAVS